MHPCAASLKKWLMRKKYVSEKELYVVTYSLSDRKPMVVNVKEVPDGEIADMLMASAYLIGFRREKLGGKYYMDGGGVNNVPIDVLIEKGYKDILVFRIYGYGVDTERRLKVPDDVHLYHVAPDRTWAVFWNLTEDGQGKTWFLVILMPNGCFMDWKEEFFIWMPRKARSTILTGFWQRRRNCWQISGRSFPKQNFLQPRWLPAADIQRSGFPSWQRHYT